MRLASWTLFFAVPESWEADTDDVSLPWLQGFIEGKYVPLGEGEDVTASMDIVEADSAEDAAAKSDNGKVGIRAKIE